MSGLRGRILSGERLVGTFLKIPTPQVAELLGRGGLDFAVADMEHAPIGVSALDGLALGARSVGLPLLIRSTGAQATAIWPALDLGCAGVMVPHVASVEDAEAVARAVKYAREMRGFSPSGRAGDYGTVDATDYRLRMDAETVIMAQIEDRAALDRLDAIAAVPEVDVLFVGPADLSLSLGCAGDAGGRLCRHRNRGSFCQGKWHVRLHYSPDCRLDSEGRYHLRLRLRPVSRPKRCPEHQGGAGRPLS